jgi:hypothetical protein
MPNNLEIPSAVLCHRPLGCGQGTGSPKVSLSDHHERSRLMYSADYYVE